MSWMGGVWLLLVVWRIRGVKILDRGGAPTVEDEFELDS